MSIITLSLILILSFAVIAKSENKWIKKKEKKEWITKKNNTSWITKKKTKKNDLAYITLLPLGMIIIYIKRIYSK